MAEASRSIRPVPQHGSLTRMGLPFSGRASGSIVICARSFVTDSGVKYCPASP